MTERLSHWQRTATPAPDSTVFNGSGKAEIAVIGGGFTGLTAALQLSGQGVDVILLEAGDLGEQASGRTNGQVIPTLKKEDPEALLNHFGDVHGERMINMIREAANDLFRLIEKYGIDCDAEQTGWLQPAHSGQHKEIVERRCHQWVEHGADAVLLDRQMMADKLGSDFYHGGWKINSGGHIQPLSLVRGLARAAMHHGARIHRQSSVINIQRRGPGWTVTTENGRVQVQQVIIATNGATPPGLWKSLSRTFLPATFYQLATEPLSREQQQRVLPGREAMSDMQADIHVLRYERDNRIITGGSLIFDHNWQQRLDAMITRRINKLLPDIGPLSYAGHWSGVVGMTPDFFPHLYTLAPGVWAWTGCNGRGISLSTRVGSILADAVAGKDPSRLPLPISELKEIPLHSILDGLLKYSLVYYRGKDWFAHRFR